MLVTMAKSIVLGILMETLGDYIDFSRDQLKMAVWSGEINISDLSLKSTSLDKLDLPIVFHGGSLSSLHLTIPWTEIGNVPVRVVLDGLCVLIGPSDDSNFTIEDLQRH